MAYRVEIDFYDNGKYMFQIGEYLFSKVHLSNNLKEAKKILKTAISDCDLNASAKIYKCKNKYRCGYLNSEIVYQTKV